MDGFKMSKMAERFAKRAEAARERAEADKMLAKAAYGAVPASAKEAATFEAVAVAAIRPAYRAEENAARLDGQARFAMRVASGEIRPDKDREAEFDKFDGLARKAGENAKDRAKAFAAACKAARLARQYS